MPPCALVSIGVAESKAQPSEWDEHPIVPAFHGLINALLLEFGFGLSVWVLCLEWPRLLHPVMAFAQHVGAAAVSAL
jgi:hypothetical protein